MASWGLTLHPGTSTEEYTAILEIAQQNGSALPGLGYAYGQRIDGSFTMAGSVVKLSDTIAVTAAHASVHWSEGEYQNIWIGFGNFEDGMDGEETVYKVAAVHRHPLLDLALYSLDTRIQSVPNAVLHAEILSVDHPIAFGGYGLMSYVGGGIHGYGNKLGAKGIINGTIPEESPEHYQYTQFAGEEGLPDYHSEGGLVDTWDSGGGVYAEVNGEYRLVGIIEVKAGEREYGSYSGFLPLSHPGAYHFVNQYLDSDADGQSNFVEEAFGSDGVWADSFSTTPMTLHPEGNGMRMVISHLALEDGTVEYKGQQSQDLSNWEAAQTVSNPSGLPVPPSGYSWFSWEVSTSGKSQFMRVYAEPNLNLIWE